MTNLSLAQSADPIQQKVSQKIQECFVDLLPDGTIDHLVKTEIARFTQPVDPQTPPTPISPLQGIIHQQLHDFYQKQVIEFINSERFLNSPTYQKYGFKEPSTFIADYVSENREQLVDLVLGQLLNNLTMELSLLIQKAFANRGMF